MTYHRPCLIPCAQATNGAVEYDQSATPQTVVKVERVWIPFVVSIGSTTYSLQYEDEDAAESKKGALEPGHFGIYVN